MNKIDWSDEIMFEEKPNSYPTTVPRVGYNFWNGESKVLAYEEAVDYVKNFADISTAQKATDKCKVWIRYMQRYYIEYTI